MLKPYYQDTHCQIYQGHALEVLRELPAKSVSMVMTSPPFWGLRSYDCEPIDWGNWKGQLGLEPDFNLYIKHLCDIFDEVRRVLRDDGTLWVNLGDSYYGGGFGHEKDLSAEDFLKKYPKQGSNTGTCMDWQTRRMVGDTKRGNQLPAKSLCLIPHRFAIEMVNRKWVLRSTIIWHKPNPMPESVKDRFTDDYEYLFFFSKKGKYYFEQQFEPLSEIERWGGPVMKPNDSQDYYPNELSREREVQPNPLGRNMRSVWEIPTQPFTAKIINGEKLDHFASYPRELCRIPIMAGCPSMICKKCGKAREKIYERNSNWHERVEHGATGGAFERGANQQQGKGMTHDLNNTALFSGYTDCGHGDFEPGTILDIFGGTGTTAEEAKCQGKKSILIELSEKYCKLTQDRISKISIPMELNV